MCASALSCERAPSKPCTLQCTILPREGAQAGFRFQLHREQQSRLNGSKNPCYSRWQEHWARQREGAGSQDARVAVLVLGSGGM